MASIVNADKFIAAVAIGKDDVVVVVDGSNTIIHLRLDRPHQAFQQRIVNKCIRGDVINPFRYVWVLEYMGWPDVRQVRQRLFVLTGLNVDDLDNSPWIRVLVPDMRIGIPCLSDGI